MLIAIWGFGHYGKRLYEELTYICKNIRISYIFDQDPAGSMSDSISKGLKVYSPDHIKDCYESGGFDAVAIGIYNAKIRETVKQQLEEWEIPVLSLKDLYAGIIMENQEVISRMQDQESLDLFLSKLWSSLGEEEQFFLDTVWQYGINYEYPTHELLKPMETCGAKRVILFGDGRDVRSNIQVLNLCNIPIAAICSLHSDRNNDQWPEFPKEKVIVPEDLFLPDYQDCLVVISSNEERELIKKKLCELKMPDNRIYDPKSDWRPLIVGMRSQQYFDVWEPRDHEIFVDCGAFDGQTILDFLKWSGGNYDAIYAFEPLPEMQNEICRKKERKNIQRLNIFPYAVWDKDEIMTFAVKEDLTASSFFWNAKMMNSIDVHAKALDQVISGPVTFIKMDVEGSEWQALNGAEQLIRKWKPRLAISIYHKYYDELKIPKRILEIVPEYKFLIRHYNAGLFETVLYAYIDDESSASISKKNNSFRQPEYSVDDLKKFPDTKVFRTEKILLNNLGEDIDAAIEDCMMYELFSKLGSLKRTILSWYPFKPDSNVLEVGGEYGTITELLREKVKGVTVLEGDPLKAYCIKKRCQNDDKIKIISNLPDRSEVSELFDYIVILNLPKDIKEIKTLFTHCRSLLKKNGFLLAGFRNKNAVRYKMGALDEYVISPYETDGLLDRNEICDLSRTFFSDQRIYCLMPDPAYAQVVWTDGFLPKQGINDRVVPFDAFNSPLTGNEAEHYKEMINNNSFDDQCNYYILEAGEVLPERHVAYAVSSADRGREHSFITRLFSDGTAVKENLYPEGRIALEESFYNLEELKEKKFLTVEQKLSCEGIVMPVIKEEPLLSHIEDLINAGDREGIIEVFLHLYQDILNSSEIDAGNYCEKKWGLQAEEAYPILKKAYIDMIPYNIFYTGKKFMYYDQEFSEAYCPAKYVLFRAVRYTYIHLKELNNLLPIDTCLKELHISKKEWGNFSRVEDCFIFDIRNIKKFHALYSWADRVKKAGDEHE